MISIRLANTYDSVLGGKEAIASPKNEKMVERVHSKGHLLARRLNQSFTNTSEHSGLRGKPTSCQ